MLRRPSVIVAASIVFVAVAVFALTRSRGPEEEASREPPTATIEIVSTPTGASVARADGGALGVTPLTTTFPKSEGELAVIVRHEGYQDRRVTVPLFSTNGRIDVTLTALGADAGR